MNSIIPALIGAGAGALLAGVAVLEAYRGNLTFAYILIICQVVAFFVFVRAFITRHLAPRAPLDSQRSGSENR